MSAKRKGRELWTLAGAYMDGSSISIYKGEVRRLCRLSLQKPELGFGQRPTAGVMCTVNIAISRTALRGENTLLPKTMFDFSAANEKNGGGSNCPVDRQTKMGFRKKMIAKHDQRGQRDLTNDYLARIKKGSHAS